MSGSIRQRQLRVDWIIGLMKNPSHLCGAFCLMPPLFKKVGGVSARQGLDQVAVSDPILNFLFLFSVLVLS